jgi:DNA-binding transcriptional LysR family regulator
VGALDESAVRAPHLVASVGVMDLDLFRGVVPFVVVAEEQSFRKAAARLGVSPAAVSKAVGGLERDVGMTLCVRGPRAVSLTREGEMFFESCRPAVTAVMGARALVEGARREPEGQLVVSVPFVVAALVPPALALLRARHPRLTFRVVVTDRLARLGEEPVDVAVRVGPLADSSLVAKRIRETRLVVAASPAYLARAGTPRRLDELDAHGCLVLLAPTGKPHPWLFRSGPREVRPLLALDHAPSLVDALLAGLGVAQVLDFMVAAHLRRGALTQVFADEVAEGPAVHAVCAPGRRATPRVRAAFEAFAAAFGAGAPPPASPARD